MDLLFLVLSFLAALAAVVIFGVGLFKYVAQGKYRQSWQMSLMMMTAASVLALMATLMDAELSLGTGFMVMGAYLFLTAVGLLLVYIVKKAKDDNVQGYVRYAGITLLAALVALVLPLFILDTADSPVREINETFGSEEGTAGSGNRVPVEVASFIDGDTTRFHFDGEEASFRYLLIDTPETNHPRVGEQPYGKEASARTKEILADADEIGVEFDVGPRQDHYERYLAYIYADGEMVNEILVREGLAKVNYVNPPNTTHLERLEAAQEKAESEGLGIWSLEHPFDSEAHQDGEGEPETGSGQFRNCTELREVHPDGVAEGHPAYTMQMDGDRDGFACE